jgi:hypothetical protein
MSEKPIQLGAIAPELSSFYPSANSGQCLVAWEERGWVWFCCKDLTYVGYICFITNVILP